ncbi:hypothetical protein WCX72_07685 [Sulfurimonas sp. HSL1-6]|uniref:hypothetical protein n=1 Tax=Thiomicrolovo immobilis TaxID=3131935 RepID=UPI0031F8EEE3
MQIFFLRLSLFIATLVALTACFEPETPQEAAAAFWSAVERSDAGDAVRYSTLEDEAAFDAFGRSWQGADATVEKVVIEGREAQIVSKITAPEGSDLPATVTTYLVQRDETWLVDYARTAEGMRGNALTALFAELTKITQDLAGRLNSTSGDLQRQLETMRGQMDAYAETLNRQMSESIGRYGGVLRERIDELAASAREALDANGEQLTPQEQQTLDDVAGEMERQSDTLSEPDADNVTEGTEKALAAQQKLLMLDEETLERYQRQWIEWRDRFEQEAKAFFDALNAELRKQKE